MRTYYTIVYELKEKDPYNVGYLKDFSTTQKTYVANIEASSKENAIEILKKDFNMLTVNVDSISEAKEMTEQEYENGEV